jgi:hypothetical protein
MSLMSRIARGLLRAPSSVPSKPAAPSSKPKPVVAPAPVPTSAPSPRTVSRRETRERISAGLLRRNEPIAPSVPGVRMIGDAEAERHGILPNGELLDDVAPNWRKREIPEGIEVRGQPLPVLPPPAAPLDPAVIAAASVAAEKAAKAAELEAQKASIEASARWKSPCKAIDADTGLQCGLMKGHTVDHRHARGPFVRVANGPVARSVDAAAWRDTVN